jgi:hypothetical protein
MKMSKQFMDKEKQAIKDLDEVRLMRQEVDDHNESLKEDSWLAGMRKNYNTALASNHKLINENNELKEQIQRLNNKAVLHRRSVCVAKGNQDAA